jgi:hypothetical protein
MPSILQKLLIQLNTSIQNIQSPPSLNIRSQRRQYYFTIGGVIASIILGFVSLVLAIKVQNSAVKIEKMDSLLSEMVKQDSINQQSLNNLAEIAKLNNESITQLVAISGTLNSQYKTTIINTEPKIKILTATSSKSSENDGYVTLKYSNSGSRPAENLFVKSYSLDEEKENIKVTGFDTDSGSVEVTPEQELNHGFTMHQDPKTFDNTVFRFDFNFTDKLGNIPHVQYFYFKFDWKGSEKGSRIITVRDKINRIDKAIAEYDKTKK